jgi:hypothetical protein
MYFSDAIDQVQKLLNAESWIARFSNWQGNNSRLHRVSVVLASGFEATAG